MPDCVVAKVIHLGAGNDGLGRIEQDALGESTMASVEHPKNGDVVKSRKDGSKGVVFAVDPARDLLSVRSVDTSEVHCYSTENFKNDWELVPGEVSSPGPNPKIMGGCLIVLVVAGLLVWGAVGLIRGCSSSPANAVSINEYANVKDDIWCMESKEALGKLIDLSAKNAYDEMNELFVSEGVTTLRKGQSVKVVDESFSGFKVHTLGGEACWVVSNVLTKENDSGPHGNATPAAKSTEQQPSDDHFYMPAPGEELIGRWRYSPEWLSHQVVIYKSKDKYYLNRYMPTSGKTETSELKVTASKSGPKYYPADGYNGQYFTIDQSGDLHGCNRTGQVLIAKRVP